MTDKELREFERQVEASLTPGQKMRAEREDRERRERTRTRYVVMRTVLMGDANPIAPFLVVADRDRAAEWMDQEELRLFNWGRRVERGKPLDAETIPSLKVFPSDGVDASPILFTVRGIDSEV